MTDTESPDALARVSLPRSNVMMGVLHTTLITGMCAWVVVRGALGRSAIPTGFVVLIGLMDCRHRS